jgi:hypothetical protein
MDGAGWETAVSLLWRWRITDILLALLIFFAMMGILKI